MIDNNLPKTKKFTVVTYRYLTYIRQLTEMFNILNVKEEYILSHNGHILLK